ncbi:hypothetical protein [Embleya sp. NPDC001921]
MDRASLESAAANYSYLRGLLSIPAGVLLLAAGLSNTRWGPLDHAWVTWAVGGLMVVAGAAYLWINRYYTENFGRITPSGRDRTRAAVTAAVGAAAVAGAVSLDWNADLPLTATTAVFAGFMFASYAVAMRPRPHHVAVWGTLVVVALLPIWGYVGPTARINVGLMLVGVATMVTGVLDHAALERTFAPDRAPHLGDGDVDA